MSQPVEIVGIAVGVDVGWAVGGAVAPGAEGTTGASQARITWASAARRMANANRARDRS
jgi:hypothetical protein